jgi:hypothetical protein
LDVALPVRHHLNGFGIGDRAAVNTQLASGSVTVSASASSEELVKVLLAANGNFQEGAATRGFVTRPGASPPTSPQLLDC